MKHLMLAAVFAVICLSVQAEEKIEQAPPPSPAPVEQAPAVYPNGEQAKVQECPCAERHSRGFFSRMKNTFVHTIGGSMGNGMKAGATITKNGIAGDGEKK